MPLPKAKKGVLYWQIHTKTVIKNSRTVEQLCGRDEFKWWSQERAENHTQTETSADIFNPSKRIKITADMTKMGLELLLQVKYSKKST